MIDEKKLIEALIQDDGMDFSVRLKHDFSPENIGNTFQEFANKMKEGFVNLINAQPKVSGGGGWVSVEDGLPTGNHEFLCRCNIDGYDEFPFYMVLRYYLTDETPHFQHETAHGLHVTHWMRFEPPKGCEG